MIWNNNSNENFSCGPSSNRTLARSPWWFLWWEFQQKSWCVVKNIWMSILIGAWDRKVFIVVVDWLHPMPSKNIKNIINNFDFCCHLNLRFKIMFLYLLKKLMCLKFLQKLITLSNIHTTFIFRIWRENAKCFYFFMSSGQDIFGFLYIKKMKYTTQEKNNNKNVFQDVTMN